MGKYNALLHNTSSLRYLSIFFMVFSFLVFPYKSAAQPKIQFPELEFDFGEMHQNTRRNHVFEFKNIGTEVLNIEKVKGG